MHIVERLAALPSERREAALRLLRSRGEDFNVYPLSFAQRRLWFLAELHGGSAVYNVPYAFWLTGNLDVVALERALQALADRHEVLRTVYFDIDGEPYQVILSPSASRISFATRRWREEDAQRPALVRRILDVEARRPFDLRSGPVMRAHVLTAGRRHLFLLTLHHIACDGWSMGVLFSELERLYAAELDGRPAQLAPLPLRYVDYARWQAEQLAGPTRERQLAYWVDRLAGAPPVLEFPGRPPASAAVVRPGAMEEVRWASETARAMAEYSRREAVTPFVTALAAFAVVLRGETGQSDIVVGTPMGNRGRAELEPLVGFFVNTLPLRLSLRGEMTFRQLVEQVREVALGAQANQDLPFDLLVDALSPDRDLTHHPVFQVAFTMQDEGFEELRLPGVDVELIRGHSGTAKFDLTAAFILSPTALAGMMEYDTERFDQAMSQRLLEAFRRILEAAVAAPNSTLGELAVQSGAGGGASRN